MAIRVPRLIREIVVRHDFTADERLQGQGSEHVQTETAFTRSAPSLRERPTDTYNRAILTITLSVGKLLRTLPFVLSRKVIKPASAIVMHAAIEMLVE